jgi:hypothetical protein
MYIKKYRTRVNLWLMTTACGGSNWWQSRRRTLVSQKGWSEIQMDQTKVA